jgi:hypothetical protein
MPYKISKVKGNKYKVTNTATKRVLAKGTTKTKAQNQVKLINMLKKKKKKK